MRSGGQSFHLHQLVYGGDESLKCLELRAASDVPGVTQGVSEQVGDAGDVDQHMSKVAQNVIVSPGVSKMILTADVYDEVSV